MRLAPLFCAACAGGVLASPLGCGGDADPLPGTLVVTFGKETDQWASVATLRLRAGATASSATDTVYEGAVDTASVDLPTVSRDASVTFVAEALDTSGKVVARGQTPAFSGAELEGDVAPLLLSPVASSSRAADGLTLPWKRGDGAVLLGLRYLVFGNATQSDAEAYDTGLLIPSVGGPGWSRAPRVLLRASTRDVFLLDEAGADFADVFSVTTASTTAVTADEATDLVRGQVLAPAATDTTPTLGQWLAGPCGDGNGATTDSDRVLYLGTDDQLVVTRLATPRRGAACALLSDGSLVLAGGSTSLLTVVSTGGAVVESPLDEERLNGGAVAMSDGSVLLLGGTSRDGVGAAPAPVRVVLPCQGACASTPLPWPPEAAESLPSGNTRAIPTSSATTPGRAFVLSDRPATATMPARSALVFVDASAGGLSVAPITLRVARTVPIAVGLAGERLLLAGGVVDGGTGSTEVEIVNSR